MSIVVVGFLAYDTVETPNGRAAEVLGGAASFFSVAACFFAPVSVVAVVGSDFKPEHYQIFTDRNIDLRAVAKREGHTTRWSGRYHEDLINRDTLELNLNVLEGFKPELLPDQRRSDYIFLAPNDPALHLHVLDQLSSPKIVCADLYDYWIENTRPGLIRELKRIHILLCNDHEARLLSGEHNLVKAARALLRLGPTTILVKRGEYGVLLFSRDSTFAVPAYPLEEVVDPTGAGDTFAGGFMGYIARSGKVSQAVLRSAVVYGSVMASFVVESFSLDRLLALSWDDVDNRRRSFLELTDPHHPRWTSQS